HRGQRGGQGAGAAEVSHGRGGLFRPEHDDARPGKFAGLFIAQKSPNLTKHEDKKSTALLKNED
ncbi:hypothetical protein, partial [Serratia sp. 22264]|uniref:hypothetical protein n=1 Tax=Serratia sp. 22264 TaxID=3453897 RepID=UPI003F86EFD4